MSKKALLKKLDQIVSEISEIQSRLKKGEINPIELELLKQQAIKLYTLVVQDDAPYLKQENVEIKAEVNKELVESTPEKLESTTKSEAPKDVTPKPVLKAEKVIEETENKEVSVKEPSETVKVEEPKKQEPKPESSSKREELKLYEKFHLSGLDSLKKGISVLKKFEYTKALFNDDTDAFNDAIKQLDNQNSGEEAVALLEKWMNEYQWEEENLVDEIKLLLYRRYVHP